MHYPFFYPTQCRKKVCLSEQSTFTKKSQLLLRIPLQKPSKLLITELSVDANVDCSTSKTIYVIS